MALWNFRLRFEPSDLRPLKNINLTKNGRIIPFWFWCNLMGKFITISRYAWEILQHNDEFPQSPTTSNNWWCLKLPLIFWWIYMDFLSWRASILHKLVKEIPGWFSGNLMGKSVTIGMPRNIWCFSVWLEILLSNKLVCW